MSIEHPTGLPDPYTKIQETHPRACIEVGCDGLIWNNAAEVCR
jgi:hypothetical protein